MNVRSFKPVAKVAPITVVVRIVALVVDGTP
jgi:hypothetical protein